MLRRHRKAIIAMVMIVALVAGALCAFIELNKNLKGIAAEEPTNDSSSTPVTISEEQLNEYYSSNKDKYSSEFISVSMPDHADERTSAAAKVGWTGGERMFDAVAIPFSIVISGKNSYSIEEARQMFEEQKEVIWRNPVIGDMIAQGFSSTNFDKTNIVEENPVLKKLLEKYEKDGVRAFLYQKDGKTYVTEEYREYAACICAILDRCSLVGVETINTDKHWPLNSATEASKVRTYENKDPNYIDTWASLNFQIVWKGQIVVKFGFNIYDDRFEIFVTGGKPVQPKTPTSPPNQPTTPPNQPTTPPAQPTTPPDVLKKDPYADPVHHENAEKGGGEGTGETKSTPDEDYTKAYSNDAKGGPDNNQGYSRPDTVAPATQQAAEPAVDNTDQNKMNYDDNKKAVNSFGVEDEVVGADSSWNLPD